MLTKGRLPEQLVLSLPSTCGKASSKSTVWAKRIVCRCYLSSKREWFDLDFVRHLAIGPLLVVEVQLQIGYRSLVGFPELDEPRNDAQLVANVLLVAHVDAETRLCEVVEPANLALRLDRVKESIVVIGVKAETRNLLGLLWADLTEQIRQGKVLVCSLEVSHVEFEALNRQLAQVIGH